MHVPLPRALAASLVLALVALPTGCGLIKVHSLTGAGVATRPTASGAAGEAEVGGPAAGPPPDGADAELAGRFTAAFRDFDHATCPDGCGGFMSAAAGLASNDHVNPKMHIGNPDPAWLPGWERLPGGTDDPSHDIMVWNAMTLAAINKRWQATCAATYDRLDGELRELDAGWARQSTEARAAAEPYARVAALLALIARFDGEGAGAGYARQLRGRVGARHALELALREEAGHDLPVYAYHYLRLDPESTFSQLRPRGTADDERALYCAAAHAGQVAELSRPPKSGFFDRDLGDIVRPPVARADAERFAGLAAASRAANQERFGGPKDAGQLRASVLPGGVEAIQGTVRAVEPTATGLAIELSDTRSTVVSYACRSTGRVSRIDRDGRVEYDQNCKLRSETDETVQRFVLPALAAGPTPAVGDRLELTGRVTGETKREPKKYQRVLRREIAAELFVALERGGKRQRVVARAER